LVGYLVICCQIATASEISEMAQSVAMMSSLKQMISMIDTTVRNSFLLGCIFIGCFQ